MSETPTPMDMPGANASPKAVEKPAEPVNPEPPKPAAPEGLSVEDKSELERLRKIHQDESKWEKRAKQNYDDAQKFRALLEAAGVDKPNEFDPRAEFERLRKEIESERTERLRAEVARVKGVDPEDIKGSTEDEMTASADRFLARLQAKIDEALKAKNIPSAPPASTVTSDGKITGPEQITSREQLKSMTPQQIAEARKEGRLNQLLGKST